MTTAPPMFLIQMDSPLTWYSKPEVNAANASSSPGSESHSVSTRFEMTFKNLS